MDGNQIFELIQSTARWLGMSGPPEIAFGALVFLIAATLTYVQWKHVMRAILVATTAFVVAFLLAMAINAVQHQMIAPGGQASAAVSRPE